MTGDQIQSDIYIGPTYYMRLKHMVKDKINYRARGPNQALTRQPVQGRANDGGLRIGEMERDGVMAHGMSYFLNESFLTRGDEYYMAVCNKTGAIAVYNDSRNLFLSPFADGPIQFHTNPDGTMNIKNISKFGRSFSILRIPYAFKLLIQELQVMNVQMRIITDENIDQLMNMSYSDNISELLQLEDKDINKAISEYSLKINQKMQKDKGKQLTTVLEDIPEYLTHSSTQEVNSVSTPEYAPVSTPDVNPVSNPDLTPEYAPVSTPELTPGSNPVLIGGLNPVSNSQMQSRYPTELNFIFMDLPREEQMELLKKTEKEQIEFLKEIADKKNSTQSILQVEEPKEVGKDSEKSKENTESSSSSSSSSGDKKVIITDTSNTSETDTGSSTRKIVF